ncbi:transcriptional regulator [Halorussus halophilus]|uniref:transcriptional regulator n=1 Tax=Halorussus halophilus TaxID=2650975 RepID=UPI001300D019|nr:transcriptional regulator [Halorussus halophilus]
MNADLDFEALAHEQRRTLLLALLESNPQDAGFESPTGHSVLTDAEQREQIEMFHIHLPKLEDHGYIEWNEETDQIVKGPQFDEIRPLLECIASDDAE